MKEHKKLNWKEWTFIAVALIILSLVVYSHRELPTENLGTITTLEAQ